jgi:hypothetical protein
MFLFSAGGNSSHVLSDGDVQFMEISLRIHGKLSNNFIALKLCMISRSAKRAIKGVFILLYVSLMT